VKATLFVLLPLLLAGCQRSPTLSVPAVDPAREPFVLTHDLGRLSRDEAQRQAGRQGRYRVRLATPGDALGDYTVFEADAATSPGGL
jgi:hypothetical protein